MAFTQPLYTLHCTNEQRGNSTQSAGSGLAKRVTTKPPLVNASRATWNTRNTYQRDSKTQKYQGFNAGTIATEMYATMSKKNTAGTGGVAWATPVARKED